MSNFFDDLIQLPETLPEQQQTEYFKLYKEGHDEYRKLLIIRNLRIVSYIARKFSHTKEEYEN